MPQVYAPYASATLGGATVAPPMAPLGPPHMPMFAPSHSMPSLGPMLPHTMIPMGTNYVGPSSLNVGPIPRCRCRVTYLGSSVPHVTKDGLQGIQEPMRELYPDHESLITGQAGIDSWLSVWSNGVLLQNIDECGREVKRFFPIDTLHYCAAVRYALLKQTIGGPLAPINSKLSTTSSTATDTITSTVTKAPSSGNDSSSGNSSSSEPTSPSDLSSSSTSSRRSSGPNSNNNNNNEQSNSKVSTTTRNRLQVNFLPLDWMATNPATASRSLGHPPVFACIMRRTTGIKVLECHAFICKRDAAANALVQCCFHAYADTMCAKQMGADLKLLMAGRQLAAPVNYDHAKASGRQQQQTKTTQNCSCSSASSSRSASPNCSSHDQHAKNNNNNKNRNSDALIATTRYRSEHTEQWRRQADDNRNGSASDAELTTTTATTTSDDDNDTNQHLKTPDTIDSVDRCQRRRSTDSGCSQSFNQISGARQRVQQVNKQIDDQQMMSNRVNCVPMKAYGTNMSVLTKGSSMSSKSKSKSKSNGQNNYQLEHPANIYTPPSPHLNVGSMRRFVAPGAPFIYPPPHPALSHTLRPTSSHFGAPTHGLLPAYAMPTYPNVVYDQHFNNQQQLSTLNVISAPPGFLTATLGKQQQQQQQSKQSKSSSKQMHPMGYSTITYGQIASTNADGNKNSNNRRHSEQQRYSMPMYATLSSRMGRDSCQLINHVLNPIDEQFLRSKEGKLWMKQQQSQRKQLVSLLPPQLEGMPIVFGPPPTQIEPPRIVKNSTSATDEKRRTSMSSKSSIKQKNNRSKSDLKSDGKCDEGKKR